MSLGLLSADSGTMSKMLFSAIPAIILLLLLAAWRLWAWKKHAPAEAPSNLADRVVNQHVDIDSRKKHKAHHDPHHHHKHARSSSSQKVAARSTRSRDQGGETKPLLPSSNPPMTRAKSQPNPYRDGSDHSSSHDMHFRRKLKDLAVYSSLHSFTYFISRT